MPEYRQSADDAARTIWRGREFVEAACQEQFGSVVDIGCGYGLHCSALARAGRRVTGIDLHVEPGAHAKAAEEGYRLIEGDWNDLPAESFDAAYSHHVLEHLRDPIGALHEWGRFVRPGGMLCLCVPAFMSQVLAGHISTGWSVGQLLYSLCIAGWDCREGRLRLCKGCVWAFVKRPATMVLHDHVGGGWGTIAECVETDGNSIAGIGTEYRWACR